MTSATERLRALLDERGVEHFDATGCTLWGYEQTSDSTGCYRCAADEVGEGFMTLRMHHITPEQAIAATLGHYNAGRYVGLRQGEYWERTENSNYYCGGCGWKVTDHDSYCPECGGALHNATLGSSNCTNDCTNGERTETCHDEGDPSDFCCSECGVRMFTNTSDTYTMIASDGRTIIKSPNYCPNCGRKVVA